MTCRCHERFRNKRIWNTTTRANPFTLEPCAKMAPASKSSSSMPSTQWHSAYTDSSLLLLGRRPQLFGSLPLLERRNNSLLLPCPVFGWLGSDVHFSPRPCSSASNKPSVKVVLRCNRHPCPAAWHNDGNQHWSFSLPLRIGRQTTSANLGIRRSTWTTVSVGTQLVFPFFCAEGTNVSIVNEPSEGHTLCGHHLVRSTLCEVNQSPISKSLAVDKSCTKNSQREQERLRDS